MPLIGLRNIITQQYYLVIAKLQERLLECPTSTTQMQNEKHEEFNAFFIHTSTLLRKCQLSIILRL